MTKLAMLPARILGIATALAFTAAVSSAQLARVRVHDERAEELAEIWERAGFDVLEGSVGGDSLELVVDPGELARLRAAGFEFEVVERGRPFARIQRERAAAGPEGSVPSGYLDLAQITASLSATAAANPSLCKLVDLGAAYGAPPTWNGRSLVALKISDNAQQEEDEPAVLVVANYHAREIVTPVIALHAIERLVTLYSSDPAVQAAVDGHEIWIVPVCNPDGYAHVFGADNLWRKNRRNNGGGSYGVDLNRNHALGWASPCSGSTNASSETYRGPSAESEPEVAAILALTADQRFAKVLDYHSSGREVLYGYSCLSHPWAANFLASEAVALAAASGYSLTRAPSAEGEHFEWQIFRGSHAFLIETHDQFQPSYASAQAEAAQVWNGIRWMLARPISVWGHVTDACTGAPLAATVEIVGLALSNGESWSSGGAFGRYEIIAPAGGYSVRFSAPGYSTAQVPVTVTTSGSVALDVALDPIQAWASYCTAGTSSSGCTATLAAIGRPSASAATSFVVTASNVEGQKTGLVFYGTSGAQVSPWAFGSTSYLCVAPPRQRTGTQPSGGLAGACNGSFTLDWNAFAAANSSALGLPLSAGDGLWFQAWFRDPPSPGSTSLSDAISASVCP